MTTHSHSRSRKLAAVPLLFAAFSTLIQGQGLGTVVGTVTDPSGGLVPNAAVRIMDEGTSQGRETVTNSQGYYVFPSMRPASYTITINAPGFASSVRKGVVLQADESATVNLSLSLAIESDSDR